MHPAEYQPPVASPPPRSYSDRILPPYTLARRYRRGRSLRGRFSADSTTPMTERRELGSHFAALQPRGNSWAGLETPDATTHDHECRV